MQYNEIIRIIYQMNPWWHYKNKGQTTYLIDKKYRVSHFEDLKKRIQNSEKVQILVGPRRVGKTTLLKQLIHDLLNSEQTTPERILYISFDHPLLLLENTSPFDKIFRVFEEIIEEKLEKLKMPVFVFLDEIQKLENWSNYVKHWLERKFLIHFIISGSSSLRILKGSGESLLGRTETKIIFPLSFKERLQWDLSWSLKEPISLEFESLLSLDQKMPPLHKEDIQQALEKHMIWGGYPELWEDKYQRQSHDENEKQKITEEKQKLLSDYKSLTFERDIFEIENVRDTVSIDGLFSLMAQSCSSKINYGKYSGALGIKNDSVRRYCGLLESIYLTKLSYAYSKNQVVNSRKDKKNYFIDPGIRNAALLLNSLNEPEQGIIAETLVASHLTEIAHHYSLNPKIFYWQEPRKGEVDFIWTYSKNPLPIEVKFQNSIQKNDQYPLLYFIQKFKLNKGILITKNKLHLEKIENKEILHIPLWVFLLLDQI